MTEPFKERDYESEIILTCVRRYQRYKMSYRDLEEMLPERGLSVDHAMSFRWVQRYAPKLGEQCRPHIKVSSLLTISDVSTRPLSRSEAK